MLKWNGYIVVIIILRLVINYLGCKLELIVLLYNVFLGFTA